MVIADGRTDYLLRMFASIHHLRGNIGRVVIHDDSGSHDHREWLQDHFCDVEIADVEVKRRGFTGAVISARNWLEANDSADYVFWLEQDFEFIRDIPLDAMADVLDHHHHITQMALRRQPWNAQETRAGGIVEMHPDDYADRTDGLHHWLEHRRFFTTNPALLPRRIVTDGLWPNHAESEGHYGLRMYAEHPRWASAFWGARDSGIWVRHIGTDRVGTGY